MSWNPMSLLRSLSSDRNEVVVGITSRSADTNLKWLMTFLSSEFKDLNLDVKYLPITNDNRNWWEAEMKRCHVGILYHTKHQGRINVVDVDGGLYNGELTYLSDVLGRHKVMVVLDDLEDDSEDERQRIQKTQSSIQRLSAHFLIFTHSKKTEAAFKKKMQFREFLQSAAQPTERKESRKSQDQCMQNGRGSRASQSQWVQKGKGSGANYDQPVQMGKGSGMNRDQQVQMGKELGRYQGDKTSSSTTVENSTWNSLKNFSIPSLTFDKSDIGLTSKLRRRTSVGIFSRSAEDNYKWLISELRNTDLLRPEDVHSVYISNNHREFYSQLPKCTFAILYHTKNQGRVNITDVTDSLYDTVLKMLSQRLRKENVIVVVDDLQDSSPAEKDRILSNQPSIGELARDLFLFNEKHETRENLGKIKEIIRKSGDKTSSSTSVEKSTRNPFKSVSPYTGFSSSVDCSALPASHKGSFNRSDAPSLPTDNTTSSTSKPRRRISVGIFSRSAEDNYKWLISELRNTDLLRPEDVHSVYISNNHREFNSQLPKCTFAILYHTKKQGRVNITNVTDSLYDTELKELSQILRKENVIVVVDDLQDSSPAEKDRILSNQPSIGELARDVFLFNEKHETTENLGKIKEIIRKSVSNDDRQISAVYTGQYDHHQPRLNSGQFPGSSSNPSNGCSDLTDSSIERNLREPSSYVTSGPETFSPNDTDDSEPEAKKPLLEPGLNTQINITDVMCRMEGLMEELHSRRSAVSQTLETINAELQNFKCMMQIYDGKMQQMRNKLLAQEEQLKHQQFTMKTLAKEANEKDNIVKTGEKLINDHKYKTDNLQKKTQELEKTIQAKDDNIEELKDKLYDKDKIIREMRNKIEEKERAVRELEEKLQEKTAREEENVKRERKHKIQDTRSAIEWPGEKLEERNSTRQELEPNVQQLERKLQEQMKMTSEKDNVIQQREMTIREMERKIQEQQETISIQGNEMNENSIKIDKLEMDIASYEEISKILQNDSQLKWSK
ncbi:centromere-associated protein E-like isoform X2 [Pseudophryne corroboree]|uniref:centromere-associated protein E-like isoform X2 n=1 Tax=Pseudophryne corroboree TaxID=495146 RepID=UPI00308202B3